MQAVPDAGHLRRRVHLHLAHARAAERALVAALGFRTRERQNPPAIGCGNKKVRPLSIIAHEERAALLEPAVQMHHGYTVPALLRDHAIAGLQDEAANFAHRPILRYRRKLWHAAAMARSGKALLDLFLAPGANGSRARRAQTAADNPGIQAIWEVVCTIPRGQVSTYGAVAQAAGLPGRARLAGLALRVAPEEMNLPWHRVLGAGGRIVFPKNSRPYREQAKRLRAEGVLSRDGRVDRSCIADLLSQSGH